MFFKRTKPFHVKFLPSERTVVAQHEVSLLDLALKHKIPIDHSCGGSGSCGTCRVVIVSKADSLGPMNFIEEAMAKARGFASDERLSCQIEPIDGLEVLVPEGRERSESEA